MEISKKRMSVRELCLKEILRLDSEIKKPEEMYSAIFLLTAAMVGPNVRRITAASKLGRALCEKFGRNARREKIFIGDRIACEWFKSPNGGISFWCDTLVIDGLIGRA